MFVEENVHLCAGKVNSVVLLAHVGTDRDGNQAY